MSVPRAASAAKEPVLIRVRAYYQTAGALLRELSRALNKGRSVIRAESGLPVASRLAIVMQTAALRSPIEVTGTVTAARRRGAYHELVVRYDFDFLRFRSLLGEAVAAFKKENPTRWPRVDARIPVALSVDAAALAKGVSATVDNFSRAGCRLELQGGRFPRIEPGSRLEMTLSGRRARRTVALVLDVRWVAVIKALDKDPCMVVGGRFLEVHPQARERIAAILAFKEHRPRLRIRRLVARREKAKGRQGPRRRR